MHTGTLTHAHTHMHTHTHTHSPSLLCIIHQTVTCLPAGAWHPNSFKHQSKGAFRSGSRQRQTYVQLWVPSLPHIRSGWHALLYWAFHQFCHVCWPAIRPAARLLDSSRCGDAVPVGRLRQNFVIPMRDIWLFVHLSVQYVVVVVVLLYIAFFCWFSGLMTCTAVHCGLMLFFFYCLILPLKCFVARQTDITISVCAAGLFIYSFLATVLSLKSRDLSPWTEWDFTGYGVEREKRAYWWFASAFVVELRAMFLPFCCIGGDLQHYFNQKCTHTELKNIHFLW